MNNYQSRARSRRLRKNILNTVNLFKFRGLQTTNAEKIIIFGAIVVLLSLFIPWVTSLESSIQKNAFSNLAGRSGIIIFIIVSLLFFMIFSKHKKEKLKMIGNLHFRNYLLGIVGGLFICISTISSLSYIGGLQMFQSDIIYGQGPIICLVGGIIIFVGSFLLRKEENSGIENIFTEETNKNKNKTDKKQKDNMKLPF